MCKFILNLAFYYCISFLPAGVAANSINRICASGWFVLPVGLHKWKITTTRSILTIKFKNILRTFQAEILKIFKNIQPQPKN